MWQFAQSLAGRGAAHAGEEVRPVAEILSPPLVESVDHQEVEHPS